MNHLKRSEVSNLTICGEGDVSTAPVAVWGRTYGADACLDCGHHWRTEQRDGGVDVALADVRRWETKRVVLPDCPVCGECEPVAAFGAWCCARVMAGAASHA